MGIETMIAFAVVAATASVIGGVNEYNDAKQGIKDARQQQQENIANEQRNNELLEKKRAEKLSDKGRRDRIESGTREANAGASGFNQNFGTIADIAFENELAQQFDTTRIEESVDIEQVNNLMAMQSANQALDIQKRKLQTAKTGAIWGTVGKVAGIGMSAVSGAASMSGGGTGGTEMMGIAGVAAQDASRWGTPQADMNLPVMHPVDPTQVRMA